MAKSAKPNTTLSENLSLFQALQVIADDETAAGELSNEFIADKKTSLSVSDSDQICLKPVAIGALIGNKICSFTNSLKSNALLGFPRIICFDLHYPEHRSLHFMRASPSPFTVGELSLSPALWSTSSYRQSIR